MFDRLPRLQFARRADAKGYRKAMVRLTIAAALACGIFHNAGAIQAPGGQPPPVQTPPAGQTIPPAGQTTPGQTPVIPGAPGQTPGQNPAQGTPPGTPPNTKAPMPVDKTNPNQQQKDTTNPATIGPLKPGLANPLIITPSTDPNPLPDYSGLHPGARTTNQQSQDYTHPTRPTVEHPKMLKLFGYDYFAPARNAIDSLRAYYQPQSGRAAADRAAAAQNGQPVNGDYGLFDPTANAVTGSNNPLFPSASGTGANGLDSSALLAGGLLGQGSILSQSGVSPLSGLQSGSSLTGAGLQGSGLPGSATNPSGLGTIPGVNGQFLPTVPAPPFGSIDVRTQVFSPIQGQFHNVISNPPANYQLGPGDVLTIQYSTPTVDGNTLRRTIDSGGRINMQSLGLVSLVGKTVEGAEKALTTQIQRMFKGAQVNISLDQIRTVSVAVVGHAYEPGTYSMPGAIATAYNLLWWAGGPTEDGTLRDVEIRRLGKTIGVVDLYKYELGAGSAEDITLQSGDVLYIPGRLSSVAVQGEVRTPAVFELMPGETLQDAIRFTGGIKASAVAQRVHINTVQPGASRVLRDIDLGKPESSKTAVFDGDLVEVLSVRDFLTNSVTIEGAVDQPSDYALTPNMRVSDLINRSRGLLDEASPIAELHHWNSDNTDTLVKVDLEKALAHDVANDLPLLRWDRIHVYTRSEVAWTGHHIITVDGEVRRHGIFTASRGMHVSDALRMAGGPLPDAFLDRAVLMHQHEAAPPTMEFVNIGAILSGNGANDPLVQDNDHLAVYAVGQAMFTPDHVVSIAGEVVAPGAYPRSDNMTISSLLSLAGGLKPNAGSQLVVTHARKVLDAPGANHVSQAVSLDGRGKLSAAEDLRLDDGDVVTIQGLGGYVDTVQTISVAGAVQSPGPIPLSSKSLRLSDAVKLAGGLRKEAYPPGAEFHRDPKGMLTSTQESVAQSIGKLRDLLNANEYQRDAAVSRLDMITATGQAQADSASAGLLGGLAGGATAAAAAAAIPNVAAGAIGNQLATGQIPVTPARTMTGAQIQPDGALAINLAAALRNPGGNDDILLKDGDQITIPEAPTTVQLIGAVVHPVGVVWKPGKGIQYYISLAGGFTFDAAKDSIEVIRAGGGIITAKKVKQILPGDVILVPTKPIATSIAKHTNALDDFFKSLTSSVLIYGIAKSIFGL